MTAHWDHVRFGAVRTSEADGQVTVADECWLDGISPDHVRVPMHRGLDPENGASIVPLQRESAIPGAAHGFVYSSTRQLDIHPGTITASR
jgi:hypothetical protein